MPSARRYAEGDRLKFFAIVVGLLSSVLMFVILLRQLKAVIYLDSPLLC